MTTPTNTRTLVLGDSHGTRLMLREALRLAQQFGCAQLVSVGDFGIWPGNGGKQFLDVVESMAAARDIGVLVVPGNHDDYDQIGAAVVDDEGLRVLRPHVRAADRGHVAQIGRHRWLLCGGAASIDGPGGIWNQNRGPLAEDQWGTDRTGRPAMRKAGEDLGGWWPQERVTDADVRRCAEAGTVDVLVTHEAPAEVPLSDGHKPVMPGAWPLGDRQRELISEIRRNARPTLGFAGHWHQHVIHRDETGTYVVLSADVTPEQVQWAIVEDDGTSERPRLLLPRRWDAMVSATARGARGRLNSRHQVISGLREDDLELVDAGPAEPYSWPEA